MFDKAQDLNCIRSCFGFSNSGRSQPHCIQLPLSYTIAEILSPPHARAILVIRWRDPWTHRKRVEWCRYGYGEGSNDCSVESGEESANPSKQHEELESCGILFFCLDHIFCKGVSCICGRIDWPICDGGIGINGYLIVIVEKGKRWHRGWGDKGWQRFGWTIFEYKFVYRPFVCEIRIIFSAFGGRAQSTF